MYLILVFFHILSLHPQSTWVEHVNADNLYSVLVPQSMKSSEKYIETSAGDYLLHSDYVASSIEETENTLYLINYHEIQTGLFAEDSIENNTAFLEVMAEDIARSMDGEVMYTNPIRDELWMSLEYRINYNDNQLNMKGKLVLTKTHLFSLQVYSEKQYALNRNREKFFNSFRLL
jgi:hypothetical protein